MSELIIEQCPETGICSIVKPDGKKVDLMPNEVEDLRAASGDDAKIKETIGDIDPGFSGSLTAEELKQLSSEIK